MDPWAYFLFVKRLQVCTDYLAYKLGGSEFVDRYLYTPAKISHDVVLIVRVISFLENGGRANHAYCSRSVNLVASSRF